VELATARKDRDVRAATERWEAAIAKAIAHGEREQTVADGLSACAM
jgi:hypothetical protein